LQQILRSIKRRQALLYYQKALTEEKAQWQTVDNTLKSKADGQQQGKRTAFGSLKQA